MESEYKSEIEFTNDTTYLTLTGELWCAFCENFWENWPRYDGTILYFVLPYPTYVALALSNQKAINSTAIPNCSLPVSFHISFDVVEGWKYTNSHSCCMSFTNSWGIIPWICYERSFPEFYLSMWNQLVFNQRLQLFVQSTQPYLLIFAWIN